MRALQRLLELGLALALGLGPLGASVLAASLHAPLCACDGCGSDGAAPSCCESDEPAGDGPALVTDERGCGCARGSASRSPEPAALPRACPGPGSPRAELARGAPAWAWSVEPPARGAAAWTGPPGEPEPGPQGSRSARGAARAAALGALRL
jgi:hypothetical protein